MLAIHHRNAGTELATSEFIGSIKIRRRCPCPSGHKGRETAKVVFLDEVDVDKDEYNTALVVGRRCDVYDSKLKIRCRLRITAMELCCWDDIPVRLWKRETNVSANEFCEDHVDYFEIPSDNFEFVAYYFKLV